MEKFFNYFDERYRQSVLNKPDVNNGPVITLSRLTGCDARLVAENVVKILNSKYGTVKWRWVDKEVIYKIASELNTETQRVESFYKGTELSDISEMIMAFSGNFVTDSRVKKAIQEVVLSMCKEGYIVLVGRGGVSIAREIKDALHIRLVSPLYWRVENIIHKMNLDIESAEEYVADNDEKRFNLIQTFLKKKSINIDYLFDATLNREHFTILETAELIVSMYDKKINRQINERIRQKPN